VRVAELNGQQLPGEAATAPAGSDLPVMQGRGYPDAPAPAPALAPALAPAAAAPPAAAAAIPVDDGRARTRAILAKARAPPGGHCVVPSVCRRAHPLLCAGGRASAAGSRRRALALLGAACAA